MSSESDGEDYGEKVMVRYSPSWRSECKDAVHSYMHF